MACHAFAIQLQNTINIISCVCVCMFANRATKTKSINFLCHSWPRSRSVNHKHSQTDGQIDMHTRAAFHIHLCFYTASQIKLRYRGAVVGWCCFITIYMDLCLLKPRGRKGDRSLEPYIGRCRRQNQKSTSLQVKHILYNGVFFIKMSISWDADGMNQMYTHRLTNTKMNGLLLYTRK